MSSMHMGFLDSASDVKPSLSEAEKRTEKVEELSAVDVDYGGASLLPPPPTLTQEEEKRLYRKIDCRLMPVVTLMYLGAFLDRGNIGNAKLAGLASQLDLVGDRYNIALTMFFVPYCICEIPANLVLKKLGASKWLPGITIVWGVVTISMGFVKTYAQLVGVRAVLGVTEAGLFPGVAFLLSIWYPRHMVQYRIGLFYGAASIAGAFSGLLAFAIEFMGGDRGLEAWSWIFILEGIATVLIGIFALFVLVDVPASASFLTPEERAYIIWKKKFDYSTIGESEGFKPKYIWAALTDWQVWLLTFANMSCVGPLYGLSLFLPSILAGFGFSTPIAQLLTVPPYVFGAIVLILFAHFSDKFQMRSPFILLGLTMCLIGFSINISNASIGAKYFGTFFCIAGSYGGFPGIITWLANNLAGQYKRAVGMALQIGVANVAGIIASNIFRSQDAPRYILGHGVELMFVGIGFITVPIAVFSYMSINKKRAEQMAMNGGVIGLSVEEIHELGDRSPGFRYTL